MNTQHQPTYSEQEHPLMILTRRVSETVATHPLWTVEWPITWDAVPGYTAHGRLERVNAWAAYTAVGELCKSVSYQVNTPLYLQLEADMKEYVAWYYATTPQQPVTLERKKKRRIFFSDPFATDNPDPDQDNDYDGS